MDEFLKYATEQDITINGTPADFYVVDDSELLIVEKDLGNYDSFNYVPNQRSVAYTDFKHIILNQNGKF